MATIRSHGATATKSVLDVVTVTASTIGSAINSVGVLADALEHKADAYASSIKDKATIDKKTSRERVIQEAALDAEQFKSELESQVHDKLFFNSKVSEYEKLFK